MLDLQTIQKARLWPEKLWDSTTQTIAAGASLQTPLISLTTLTGKDQLLRLVDVATRRNPSLWLNITADDTKQNGLLTALRPDGSPGPGEWPATSQLTATLQNVSENTAILTQADYGLWVTGLTTAAAYRFGALTPAQQKRLDANTHLRDLVDDGLRPFNPDQLIDREDMVDRWLEVTFDGPVNTAQRSQVYSKRVPPGRVYVLAAFRVDASATGSLSLSDQQSYGLQLHVSRTDQPDYWNPSLVGMDGQRWIEVWVPEISGTLTIELAASRNYPSNVAMTALIADMPLSTLNDIRWSAVTNAAPTAATQKLWNEVKLGQW